MLFVKNGRFYHCLVYQSTIFGGSPDATRDLTACFSWIVKTAYDAGIAVTK